MEDMYKVVHTEFNLNRSNDFQNELNSYYNEGYDLIQMIPVLGSHCMLIFKKRDPYKQITDTCPAQMYPKTHFFKNGEELSTEQGKVITLRDMLNFFRNEIEKGTPVRIFSKYINNSVVGSVINGKELIPENVYDYRYIDARIEPNIRMEKAPDVLVIIVE